MSTEYQDLYSAMGISNCCGAKILGEVINGIGLCSQCREWSETEETEETEEVE